MRIKKVTQTTPIQAEVVDSLDGNSTTNAPSVRAVNDGLLDKYSTEEQVIGTWIDGKHLYRKVIVKTITKSGNNVFRLSSVGLENIVKYVTLKSISNGNPINEDYYTTNADLLRTLINYDGLHIQLGTNYPSVPCLVYTIVEYTKTTD